MVDTRLVVVSAGVTQPSSTRLLADRLREATVLAAEQDGSRVGHEVVELNELAVDIARAMVGGAQSPALMAAVEQVRAADGMIVATPIFAASYSGLFKSFFDILDPDLLTGKPVLLAATGGTERHALALEHALRPLFAYLRAVVAPTAVFAAPSDWGRSDPLAASLPDRVGRAGRELAWLMRATKTTRPSHAKDEVGVVPFAQTLEALGQSPRPGRGQTGQFHATGLPLDPGTISVENVNIESRVPKLIDRERGVRA